MVFEAIEDGRLQRTSPDGKNFQGGGKTPKQAKSPKCKHTLGAAQLAKRKFEEQGIPLLTLDGDGCDRSHGGEGQTSTRLGAFLEMLNTETDENTDRQEELHDE